eukprot:10298837-Alexandrium_andersonii.AAC.1
MVVDTTAADCHCASLESARADPRVSARSLGSRCSPPVFGVYATQRHADLGRSRAPGRRPARRTFA